MEIKKTKGGYYYKIYKNGKKKRISKKEYLKRKYVNKMKGSGKLLKKCKSVIKNQTSNNLSSERNCLLNYSNINNFKNYINLKKMNVMNNSGVFSTIYSTKIETNIDNLKKGDNVVLKKFNNSLLDKNNEDLLEHVELLKTIIHPCLIKVYSCIIDSDDKYLIMEYVEGNNLLVCINTPKIYEKLEENNNLLLYVLIYQLLIGIKFLHNKNLTHRDLKPENIMITDDYRVKIIDFDFLTNENRNNDIRGSPLFLHPKKLISNSFSNYLLDIWALGVCFYIMIFQNLPFNIPSNLLDLSPNQKHILCAKIEKQQVEKTMERFPNKYHSISYDIKRLISLMLDYNNKSDMNFICDNRQKWMKYLKKRTNVTNLKLYLNNLENYN